MPKVFQGIIYIQIDAFMKHKLSNLLTGFRENHSTQHWDVNAWNLEEYAEKGGYVCALFMDLTKAFDTIHDLMPFHGFSRDAIQYMRSYLTNWRQDFE